MTQSARFCVIRRFTALVIVLVAALAHSGLMAQAVLNPGQFTGRVRIGIRPILSGTFRATSTSPTGFGAIVGLLGTMWNGSDFSGPLDPYGYGMSPEALNPATQSSILYDIEAYGVTTSSGLGDTDFLTFPIATNRTIVPITLGDPTVVEFIEDNPGTLHVEVVNLGCPTTTFAPYVTASLQGNTAVFTHSYDSQTTTIDGNPARIMDMPLLTGLGPYVVSATIYLYGATEDYVSVVSPPTVSITPGLGVTVRFDIHPICPCTTGGLSGMVTLNGAASYNLSENTVYKKYYAEYGTFPPPNYSFSGLREDTYLPRAHSNYYPGPPYGSQATLFWPWGKITGVTGYDPSSGPYVDLDCDAACVCEQRNVDFVSDASFLEGNITFGCFDNLQSTLVTFQSTIAGSVDPFDLPSGLPVGSYGGTGAAYTIPATGHYLQILTPGNWAESTHTSRLVLTNPDRNDPIFKEYVSENLFISDYRFAPSNPFNVLSLDPLETEQRNFSYELGKYTVTFTINGGPGDGSKLRLPQLVYSGPYGSADYTVYADGQGEVFNRDLNGDPTLPPDANGNGDVGKVTFYLPKGEYGFKPYATRALDGSQASFPNVYVLMDCGVDSRCDIGCPAVQWLPSANSCAPTMATVSGTASDPDGIARIRYRRVPASTFTDIEPPDSPFSGPLSLLPGVNVVELEVTDGAGHVYDEARPVYSDTYVDPTLTWTTGSPADGYVTAQPSINVQAIGSATADTKIASITLGCSAGCTVNGASSPVTITAAGSQTLQTFNQTVGVTLQQGWNDITLKVVDVCGRHIEVIRRVRYDLCAGIVCTALDQCHDPGTCDSLTGVCSNPIKADGSICDDGAACSLTDTCQSGTCVGANPVVCAAPDPCHDPGTCQPATGTCFYPARPDGSACNDGSACTTSDMCSGGVCVGGPPPPEVCNGVDDDCDGVVDETCDGFVTGGGQIQVPGGAANFGFNAKIKPAGTAPRGNLNYLNHARGLHVRSESILTLRVFGTTAIFSGACRKAYGGDSEVPCTFTATVEDKLESGKNVDRFQIEVSGEPAEGSTPAACPNGGGPLDCKDPMTTDCRCYKGNIQIHFQPMFQAMSRADAVLLDSPPDPTVLTGAGAAGYNAGTSFMGVPLTGLRFGMGMDINNDGTGEGDLEVTLLGTDSQGQPQHIAIESLVTGGYVTGPGEALISSVGSVDMGDGSPPMTGVSVALSLVPGPVQTGLAVVVGGSSLPSAAMNGGGLTLPPCSVPAEPAGLTLQNATQLNWSSSPASSSYNLYRGAIVSGGFAFNHVCLPPPVSGTSSQDSSVPLSGRALYYLVSGRNNCGEGSLGQMSNEQPRPNLSPCP